MAHPLPTPPDRPLRDCPLHNRPRSPLARDRSALVSQSDLSRTVLSPRSWRPLQPWLARAVSLTLGGITVAISPSTGLGLGMSLGVSLGLGSAMAPAIAQTAGQTPALSLWRFNDQTQVLEVVLPAGVTPRSFLLARPMRVVVDFPNTALPGVPPVQSYGGPVSRVTWSQYDANTARVVMELDANVVLAPRQVEVVQLDADRWSIRPVIANPEMFATRTPTPVPTGAGPTTPLAPLPSSGSVTGTTPPAPAAALLVPSPTDSAATTAQTVADRPADRPGPDAEQPAVDAVNGAAGSPVGSGDAGVMPDVIPGTTSVATFEGLYTGSSAGSGGPSVSPLDSLPVTERLDRLGNPNEVGLPIAIQGTEVTPAQAVPALPVAPDAAAAVTAPASGSTPVPATAATAATSATSTPVALPALPVLAPNPALDSGLDSGLNPSVTAQGAGPGAGQAGQPAAGPAGVRADGTIEALPVSPATAATATAGSTTVTSTASAASNSPSAPQRLTTTGLEPSQIPSRVVQTPAAIEGAAPDLSIVAPTDLGTVPLTPIAVEVPDAPPLPLVPAAAVPAATAARPAESPASRSRDAAPAIPTSVPAASDPVPASPAIVPFGTKIPAAPSLAFGQPLPSASPGVAVPSLPASAPALPDRPTNTLATPWGAPAPVLASTATQGVDLPPSSQQNPPVVPTVALPAAPLQSLPQTVPPSQIGFPPVLVPSAPSQMSPGGFGAVPLNVVPSGSVPSGTASSGSRDSRSRTSSDAESAAFDPTTFDPMVLLPKDSEITLRYTGTEPLRLDREHILQEVLVVAEDVYDPLNRVVLPAGSQIIGRFEMGGRGPRFVAQAVALNAGNQKLVASSDSMVGDRQNIGRSIGVGSGIGAAAGAVIGGGLGALGGAAAGAATGYLFAPQNQVIEPNQIVVIRLREDWK
ncbi:MAG: AMIN domain-containing protein [Prochlorothrix sp.]